MTAGGAPGGGCMLWVAEPDGVFDAGTTSKPGRTLEAMRQRLRWLALHGVVRALSAIGMRRGDPQARMIADPVVRADPAAFADEIRVRGAVVRCRAVLMTFDHGAANDVLRSDDFEVSAQGGGLPRPLRWVVDRTDTGLLHPLQPPSLLSVEPPDHTRYRKLVSSVFTTRAVARLRDRVADTANVLLDSMGGGAVLFAAAGRGHQ